MLHCLGISVFMWGEMLGVTLMVSSGGDLGGGSIGLVQEDKVALLPVVVAVPFVSISVVVVPLRVFLLFRQVGWLACLVAVLASIFSKHFWML